MSYAEVKKERYFVVKEKWEVGERMVRPKRRRKKKLSRFTVFGVLTLCTVLCSVAIYKNAGLKETSAEYSRQLQELKQEQKKLEDEKKDIEEYKSYVKTDEYVEDTARDKLGLVYPDEIIFEPEDKK